MISAPFDTFAEFQELMKLCPCYQTDSETQFKWYQIITRSKKDTAEVRKQFFADKNKTQAEAEVEIKALYLTVYDDLAKVGMVLSTRPEMEAAAVGQAKGMADERAKLDKQGGEPGKTYPLCECCGEAAIPPTDDQPMISSKESKDIDDVECPRIKAKRLEIFSKNKKVQNAIWEKVDAGSLSSVEAQAQTKDVYLDLFTDMIKNGLMEIGMTPAELEVMAEESAENFAKKHAQKQAEERAKAGNQAETEVLVDSVAEAEATKAHVEAVQVDSKPQPGTSVQPSSEAIIKYLELKIKLRDTEIQQLRQENQGLVAQNKELKDIIQGHEYIGSSMLPDYNQTATGMDQIQAQLRNLVLGAQK